MPWIFFQRGRRTRLTPFADGDAPRSYHDPMGKGKLVVPSPTDVYDVGQLVPEARMDFIKSYRETFAAVGVHLTDEDGTPVDQIQEAEQRLGIKIPESLRDYYLCSGSE